MESLAGSEVPVPPILWYGDEPEFFGRPYFVAGFVESFKLTDRPDLPPDEINRLARLAVSTLAALHEVNWKSRRAAWGDPQPLSEEINRLDHLLDRPTLDPREVEQVGGSYLIECVSMDEAIEWAMKMPRFGNPDYSAIEVRPIWE